DLGVVAGRDMNRTEFPTAAEFEAARTFIFLAARSLALATMLLFCAGCESLNLGKSTAPPQNAPAPESAVSAAPVKRQREFDAMMERLENRGPAAEPSRHDP